MRKFILFLTGVLILATSFATSNVIKPKLNAAEIFLPVGKTGQKISLLELTQIKVKDFQKLTGRKMDVFDKASFTLAQKKASKMINRDGTINNKMVNKFIKKRDGETGFHIGGFALGFLLGGIGILIAYLINDDYKSNRVKWAWIGAGVALVIWLLLFLLVLDAVNHIE